MNKEQFFEKFWELNPKPLWSIDGFTREGEKDPAFVLRAYSISGHVIIMQQFNGSEGCTFYFPEMHNSWEKSWQAIENICQNIPPYKDENPRDPETKVFKAMEGGTDGG